VELNNYKENMYVYLYCVGCGYGTVGGNSFSRCIIRNFGITIDSHIAGHRNKAQNKVHQCERGIRISTHLV